MNCGAIYYKLLYLEQILLKKMRLNQIFCKSRHHARAPQNETKVPFKELRPLALKNKVTGGAKKSIDDKCLFEMSLVFKCWKENEFNEKLCQSYMQQLVKCYTQLMQTTAKQKELKKVDAPTPGAKSFTSRQINYLLHMYPNV